MFLVVLLRGGTENSGVGKRNGSRDKATTMTGDCGGFVVDQRIPLARYLLGLHRRVHGG